MTRVNITENIWYDPDVKNYVMLDVTDIIPEQSPCIIEGIELMPKDEYHVSLVPAGRLSDDGVEVTGIIEDIQAYLAGVPEKVKLVGLSEERYFCKKEDEATMIAPAIIIGLDELCAVVRKRVPTYNSIFPHVTLLKSTNSQYGISIKSKGDLMSYCMKL